MVHASCKIALSLYNKLEKEQDDIVRQGILAPVEVNLSDQRKVKLTVFLDPKNLNKAIYSEHHPVQQLDDMPRLHGSTLFF